MSTVSGKYLQRTPVFIASPSDLNAEREIFPKIIEKVNLIKAKSKGILLEAVGWEDTLLGKGRPQKKINEDVKHSDLIVMLLWKRWGSATGEYSSGFEEEYEIACANDKNIWLYFRSISDDMMADPGPQLQKVLEFRDKVETEKKFLFRRYEDENAWEEQFIKDLCRWLDGLQPVTSQGFPPDTFPSDKVAEYEQRIKQLEKELGIIKTEQVRIAYTWAKEAWEHADEGLITKAEEYFARAIAISPQPHIVNDYGRFLMRIGAWKKAEERFMQTMKMCELIEDRVACAAAYGNLGVLYESRGDLKAAEEMYKKSLAIDEELGLKEGIASDYGNLGILYTTRGDLKSAEEVLKKSLAIDEELGRKEGMANQYGNLGNLYSIRGDLKAAEEMFKKSLAIDEELGRKEGMANTYGNLGVLYKTRGDLKAAEEMYKKSLAIDEELGRKEGMANQYGNLGVLYKTRGDLKAAEEMYKKSLAIDEELGRKEGIASDYGNLGVLYASRGDFKGAEEMFRKSLAIDEELGRKEGMATQYGNLGVLYAAHGDLKAAKKMYKKSLAIFISLGNKTMIRKVRSQIEELKKSKKKYESSRS
jgi:tetratricopeptide (TPR) repeat protein